MNGWHRNVIKLWHLHVIQETKECCLAAGGGSFFFMLVWKSFNICGWNITIVTCWTVTADFDLTKSTTASRIASATGAEDTPPAPGDKERAREEERVTKRARYGGHPHPPHPFYKLFNLVYPISYQINILC